jgi:hypothetical protein
MNPATWKKKRRGERGRAAVSISGFAWVAVGVMKTIFSFKP